VRLLRFIGFWLFPRWMMQREMRRALWEAFQTQAVTQRSAGAAIQFSAAEFDGWCWLWSERRRLERERDRFVELCDRMNRINTQLKADLARLAGAP
jgi:hypothetical protein